MIWRTILGPEAGTGKTFFHLLLLTIDNKWCIIFQCVDFALNLCCLFYLFLFLADKVADTAASTGSSSGGLIGGVTAAAVIMLVIIAVVVVYIIKRRKGWISCGLKFMCSVKETQHFRFVLCQYQSAKSCTQYRYIFVLKTHFSLVLNENYAV